MAALIGRHGGPAAIRTPERPHFDWPCAATAAAAAVIGMDLSIVAADANRPHQEPPTRAGPQWQPNFQIVGAKQRIVELCSY